MGITYLYICVCMYTFIFAEVFITHIYASYTSSIYLILCWCDRRFWGVALAYVRVNNLYTTHSHLITHNVA